MWNINENGYVTEQNGGLAACHQKSQTSEANTGAKGNRFYLGAEQSGRMADTHLKAHLLSKMKTRGCVQSSCSNLKHSP